MNDLQYWYSSVCVCVCVCVISYNISVNENDKKRLSKLVVANEVAFQPWWGTNGSNKNGYYCGGILVC